ncbi:hypothetical protein [Polaromonas sp. AER18D-145]|nr:hypothetical protein [Polaromonas sp. AER18D-145]
MHIPTLPIGSISRPLHFRADPRVFVGVVPPVRSGVEMPEEGR